MSGTEFAPVAGKMVRALRYSTGETHVGNPTLSVTVLFTDGSSLTLDSGDERSPAQLRFEDSSGRGELRDLT
jgi:hypothetical protein